MTTAAGRERLGSAVRRRRRRLGLTIVDAARIAKINRNTWDALESGARQTRDANYAAIERTLQWQPGSIEAVLDGGEPTPVPDSQADDDQQSPYHHPELGEITHKQDVQLWEATTFDEDTRVGFIFQARAKRMREEAEREHRQRATG